jgi:solute carrier family 25 (mitochondrial citrate transporter), member 1
LINQSIDSKPPGAFNILRTTLKTAGVQGIYSGCQTLAISNALKSGVRFVSFEAATRNLNNIFEPCARSGTSSTNPWINLGAGLCAGVTESILVVTPGEYLKTVVIHDASLGGRLGHRSIVNIVSHTIHQNGFFSLWRGVVPVVCKQGTNSAVRFTTFGALRNKLRQTWPETMNEAASTFIAGAGSGVITV